MAQRTLPPRDRSGRSIPAGLGKSDEETPSFPAQSTAHAVPLPPSCAVSPIHLTSSFATRAVYPDRTAPPARDASPAYSISDHAHTLSPADSGRPQSPHIFQHEFNTAVRNILSWRPSGNAGPVPREVTPTSHPGHAANSFPPLPASAVSHGTPTGLAAMPVAKSKRAPRFSDQDGEILSKFLREYEDLADRNGLTEKQKVETILRYVSRPVKTLWLYVPGYAPANWRRFCTELERLYPDFAAQTRCTRQGLTEFLKLSAESLIRDENDVMTYYWNFLTIAQPLLKDNKLTNHNFNAEFFKGFHVEDQDILADQVFNINPRHPPHEPFEVEDVVSAACRYFASDRFHKPLQLRVRSEFRGRSKTYQRDQDKRIQRLFGDKRSPRSATRDDDSDSDQEEDKNPSTSERPAYETCSVRFKEPGSTKAQHEDEDDPVALLTKLKGLSVNEPSYLVLYSQCQERFPNIAQHVPKPDLFATTSSAFTTATVAYQSHPVPVRQPWAQHTPTPTPVVAASDGDTFFYDRNGARSRACAFCGMLGHRIRGCPTAEEYVNTGRVKIVGNRLHLPTGEPIPNDGCRLGLKASIDTWLAANAQRSTETVAPTTERDPPPHATKLQLPNPPGARDTKLHDMCEVFATRKRESRPPKSSVQAPAASAVPLAPSIPTGHAPQY